LSQAFKQELSRRKRERLRYGLLSIVGIGTFFGLWEIVARAGLVNSRIIAPPSEIFLLFIRKFYDVTPDNSLLQFNILASLQTALIGFLLGVVVGVPMGWLRAWYKPVDKFLGPIFEVIRPIPPISWIPLSILWVGIGLKARAFIIFFAALIPCVINSYTGVKLTTQVLLDVAKTCGASRFTIFTQVAIPYSLPMVFTGIRVALTNSWTTLVAAEMLASNIGLGYMILMGRSFSRPDLIILGMLVIGLLGALLNYILLKIEGRVLKWKVQQDG